MRARCAPRSPPICGRSLNAAWLEFSAIEPRDVTGAKLQELLQWVKQVSHRYRGALLSTFLRDDGYAFSQIGNFVERADNTARILDMKYYVLLPRTDLIGGDVDIQQWTLILRAASAHRSYRHVYHDRYKAWNIADYLILRPEMPRSLIFCVGWINRTLDMLEEIYGGKSAGHDAAAEVTAHARRQFDGPHLRLRPARVPHRVHRPQQQDHRGARRKLQFLLMKHHPHATR